MTDACKAVLCSSSCMSSWLWDIFQIPFSSKPSYLHLGLFCLRATISTTLFSLHGGFVARMHEISAVLGQNVSCNVAPHSRKVVISFAVQIFVWGGPRVLLVPVQVFSCCSSFLVLFVCVCLLHTEDILEDILGSEDILVGLHIWGSYGGG